METFSASILSIQGIFVTFGCIFALIPGRAPRIKPEVDMSGCLNKHSNIFSVPLFIICQVDLRMAYSCLCIGLSSSTLKKQHFNIFAFVCFLAWIQSALLLSFPYWLLCFASKKRLNHKPNGSFHQPENNESLGFFPLRSAASELVHFPGV